MQIAAIVRLLKFAGVGFGLLAVYLFWSHYTGLKDKIDDQVTIITDYQADLAAADKINENNLSAIDKLKAEKGQAVGQLEKISGRELSAQKEINHAHVKIEQIAQTGAECPVADSVIFALDRLQHRPEDVPPGDLNRIRDPGSGYRPDDP